MKARKVTRWECGQCRVVRSTRAKADACCVCIECGKDGGGITGTPPSDVGSAGSSRYGSLCRSCAHRSRLLYAEAELRNAADHYARALRGAEE